MERGQFFLKLLVDVLRAADETHTAHAVSVGIQRVVRCLHNIGVGAETEVVVRTEIQHLLPIHGDLRALLAGDDALALVQPGFFNGGQFGLKLCFQFSVHVAFEIWREFRAAKVIGPLRPCRRTRPVLLTAAPFFH